MSLERRQRFDRRDRWRQTVPGARSRDVEGAISDGLVVGWRDDQLCCRRRSQASPCIQISHAMQIAGKVGRRQTVLAAEH